MKLSEKYISKRKEMIRKIEGLIEKHDLDELTIRFICTELGISTGSFYHYFPGKGNIAWVLFLTMDEHIENNIVPNFGENSLENLKILARGYADKTQASGVKCATLIGIAPFNNNQLNYLASSRFISVTLTKIFEDAIANNEITSNFSPEELCELVLISMRGFGANWAKSNGEYCLKEQIEGFIDIFIAGIKTLSK